MSERHHGQPVAPDEPRRWLDEPRNVEWIFRALLAACALLLVVDFFLHRHAHFSFEAIPGFYGIFSFAAFWCIVIIGKNLRKLLMRSEDYYDR
ncbi:MAG: hypothetical protein AAF560_25760 [Acidobacteriota bacterium]